MERDISKRPPVVQACANVPMYSLERWNVDLFCMSLLMCESKETYNNKKRHFKETSGGAGVRRCAHVLPGEMKYRPHLYVSFDVCASKETYNNEKRHIRDISGGAGVCRCAHVLPQ